jgi:hypothetical protein
MAPLALSRQPIGVSISEEVVEREIEEREPRAE